MKRILQLALFLATVLFPLQTQAEFDVPVSKESDLWKVELLAPSKDKDLVQGEMGKHEVYRLVITNKGQKVYNVQVGAFRNEPGTNIMYGLAPQLENNLMVKGDTFKFMNFPVKSGTKKLEFVITWEGKPVPLQDGTKAPGRLYKETIVFKPAR